MPKDGLPIITKAYEYQQKKAGLNFEPEQLIDVQKAYAQARQVGSSMCH
jgi:hypothetical protein